MEDLLFIDSYLAIRLAVKLSHICYNRWHSIKSDDQHYLPLTRIHKQKIELWKKQNPNDNLFIYSSTWSLRFIIGRKLLDNLRYHSNYIYEYGRSRRLSAYEICRLRNIPLTDANLYWKSIFICFKAQIGESIPEQSVPTRSFFFILGLDNFFRYLI